MGGDPETVEKALLEAARGSIMQLAWLIEAETGDRIGINPDAIAMLRAPRP